MGVCVPMHGWVGLWCVCMPACACMYVCVHACAWVHMCVSIYECASTGVFLLQHVCMPTCECKQLCAVHLHVHATVQTYSRQVHAYVSAGQLTSTQWWHLQQAKGQQLQRHLSEPAATPQLDASQTVRHLHNRKHTPQIRQHNTPNLSPKAHLQLKSKCHSFRSKRIKRFTRTIFIRTKHNMHISR